MTSVKGRPARNRKVAPDHKFVELFHTGLSNAEIAERLGCTRQAVGDRLHRLNLNRKKPAPAEPVLPARRKGVVYRHYASVSVSLPRVAGYYEADRRD